MIVGSIGPYGAHLHDGSEYSGDYADRISVETIQNWHRIRINAIMDVGVDALAIETIPCLVIFKNYFFFKFLKLILICLL